MSELLWLRTARTMYSPTSQTQLRVTYAGASKVFDQAVISVGRDASADVVIALPDVSRRHAEFRRISGGWIVADLGSTNGTQLNGQALRGGQLVAMPARVRVGGVQGADLVVEPLPSAPSSHPSTPPPAFSGHPRHPAHPRQPYPQPQPQSRDDAAPLAPPGQIAHGTVVLSTLGRSSLRLTIGRTSANDVVLDDPLVSRNHATLLLGPPPVLQDLGSFNGTFVNGVRVQSPVALHAGDEVIIGNQTLVWTGDQLVARATRQDLTLVVRDITTVVRKGKKLLQDITCDLEPATLTAVIGPSGAGKSTLLGALTGLRPATSGAVVWQGNDLYRHYDQLRYQIGLVPQQDIQHPQLTVRQALEYAARLRLPPDTTAPERAARVDQVVKQMQLGAQFDNRIGTQLSGGQRKRVSIATELLTAPPLLFLDEPTSGLDPGLDRDVMQLLRQLADEGRVVMVVTHSVMALDVCDNVAVLAPGGHLAYFGPPDGVLPHFQSQDYPQVFAALNDPARWQRRPLASKAGLPTTGMPALNPAIAPPPRQSIMKQLATLAARNIAVTVADRLLLAMLVLMPIVLGGLSRVVQGNDGLSVERIIRGPGPPSGEVTQRLIILIVAASLMGTAVTIRELVKERPIFQREYAVGLSPGIYLLSKILVLGTACFVQGVLVSWLATVGLPGPDGSGVLGLNTVEVMVAMGLVAMTMAVFGLAVSAVVTSNEQTMPVLVGLVMLQLVFCGALVEIVGRPVLEQTAWFMPARWGYAAAAVTTNVTAIPKPGANAVVDPLFTHSANQWFANMIFLVLLMLLVAIAGHWFVRRSAKSA